MKYFSLLFSFVLFFGCNDDHKENYTTYFGGQIINPKSDKVFISKDDKVIDSAKLGDNNKFLMELDSIKIGLYTFSHGPELQFIYLEPKDSLLIRLNTWDFDESLVFSGKGAERNNFLINLFLENEKEDKLFFDYYHLSDTLFEAKIDSVQKRKKLFYDQFKQEITDNSPLFEKIAEEVIYFPLYRKKEAYPYRHKRAVKSEQYPQISPAFYKFRKNIDINDKELANFYTHRDYVRTYLYHLAYEKQIIDDHKSTMELNFMKAAVENIKLDEVKNKFLHEGMWLTLLDENSTQEEKEMAQRLFFDHCTDEKSVAEISHLIRAAEMAPAGQKLPEISVYDFNKKDAMLGSIIKNNNTILYTWPNDLRQIENLAKRVNYLEQKYPEFLFIGINSKNNEYNWKKYISSKKMNPNNQYCVDKGNEWLDINFARAIIVNKNGIVMNNMTHLSSRNFELQIKNLNKN